MAQVVDCPECRRQLQIPEQYAGKRVRCPECRADFVAGADNLSVPKPAPAAPRLDESVSPSLPGRSEPPTPPASPRPRQRTRLGPLEKQDQRTGPKQRRKISWK